MNSLLENEIIFRSTFLTVKRVSRTVLAVLAAKTIRKTLKIDYIGMQANIYLAVSLELKAVIAGTLSVKWDYKRSILSQRLLSFVW